MPNSTEQAMSSAGRTAWPRALTTMSIWVALFGLLAAFHFGADMIGPLFLALNLIIAAWPVRDRLLAAGAPRLVATLGLALVVFAVLGIAMFALGWGVSQLVNEMPQYNQQFTALYQQAVDLLASFGITQSQVIEELKSISPSSMAGVATKTVTGVSGAASLVVVAVIVVFMVAMDSPTFEQRARVLSEHRPQIGLALSDFIVGVRRYWVVTTVFGLIVAVLDTALLMALGVPLAVTWGIVSFLTNYIPNVGFLIGIVPPVLMALLDRGPVTALIVFAAYCVVNFVIQSVIQPKFNGDAVGVTALVSFLSLLLWSTVLGPLGALLGLPATLFLKAILIDHDPEARWFNAFVASDPDTAHEDQSKDAAPAIKDEAQPDAR